MIDLHTHILPGIDDGSTSLETSLEMARIAVDDGTTVMACTPHIYPGLYMNDSPGIHAHRDNLQKALDLYRIPLKLVVGADAHLVPELLDGLKTGRVPTLNGSRYFLLEPSHHVAPPQFESSVFSLMAAGYTPVLTHPERLVWIEENYDVFVTLARRGVWMQLTAGALLGKFGKRARYWSDRFLDDGLVHLIASDAHTTNMRNPRMAEAVKRAEAVLGAEEARRLVLDRPQAILDDVDPSQVPPPPGLAEGERERPSGGKPWYRRLWGKGVTMAEHAPVTLSIIAAMDRNRLIGVGGLRMPWHLPADLQHFKRTTMGRPLIMGRRTHDSIGRVLPGRLNIVLTRGQGITPVAGQLDTARSLDDAIAQATAWLDDRPQAPREVCVIGGAEVYAQALPRADRLVITEIDAEFEGDVYFPDAIGDRTAWTEATREHHPAAEPSGFGFDFVTYRRSDQAQPAA